MCWFLGILRHSADGRQNSTTHPVPPAVPMMPMMCRITSYKSTVEWLGEKSGKKWEKLQETLGKHGKARIDQQHGETETSSGKPQKSSPENGGSIVFTVICCVFLVQPSIPWK
jgi:hypothetical protein